MSCAAAANHSCAGLAGAEPSWSMKWKQGRGGKGTKTSNTEGEKKAEMMESELLQLSCCVMLIMTKKKG